MTTKTMSINGVKVNVTEEGNNTFYETGDGMVKWMQSWAPGRRLILTGNAFGREAGETAKRLFPNLDIKPRRGASDDDGGEFEDYEFFHCENF